MGGNRVYAGWQRIMLWMALVSSIVLLAACSSQSGQDFSATGAAQIRSGVTDKGTVVKNLGEPFQRYVAPNGDETWTYAYSETHSSLTAKAFIPFVGGFLPNSSKSSNDTKRVTITFHGDIVASCSFVTSSSSATGTARYYDASGKLASGQGSNTTQATNCGDAPGK